MLPVYRRIVPRIKRRREGEEGSINMRDQDPGERDLSQLRGWEERGDQNEMNHQLYLPCLSSLRTMQGTLSYLRNPSKPLASKVDSFHQVRCRLRDSQVWISTQRAPLLLLYPQNLPDVNPHSVQPLSTHLSLVPSTLPIPLPLSTTLSTLALLPDSRVDEVPSIPLSRIPVDSLEQQHRQKASITLELDMMLSVFHLLHPSTLDRHTQAASVRLVIKVYPLPLVLLKRVKIIQLD